MDVIRLASVSTFWLYVRVRETVVMLCFSDVVRAKTKMKKAKKKTKLDKSQMSKTAMVCEDRICCS